MRPPGLDINDHSEGKEHHLVSWQVVIETLLPVQ